VIVGQGPKMLRSSVRRRYYGSGWRREPRTAVRSQRRASRPPRAAQNKRGEVESTYTAHTAPDHHRLLKSDQPSCPHELIGGDLHCVALLRLFTLAVSAQARRHHTVSSLQEVLELGCEVSVAAESAMASNPGGYPSFTSS
jgi:hypothetical protein